jgi:hypothetical protein
MALMRNQIIVWLLNTFHILVSYEWSVLYVVKPRNARIQKSKESQNGKKKLLHMNCWTSFITSQVLQYYVFLYLQMKYRCVVL